MGKDISSNLLLALEGISKILIIIKGSPDPDVLASSFALHTLCEWKGINATIISPMEISLPQNRELVQKLDIPVHFIKKIYSPDEYDGYAVLDHQLAWIDDIGVKIPCLIHIDHHTPGEDRIEPKFKFISDEVGAVSTIFAGILRTLNPDISRDLFTRVMTALFYGIKIDTDNFRLAQDEDVETADWLKSRADQQFITNMGNIPYSEETITIISKAIMNSYFYKDWLLCGVGYIPEKHRDSIAVAADYMIENEDVFAVVVFALIENNIDKLYLDASIRAREESFNLNKFIKYISPEGGARSFKGAFQVPLSFFRRTPNRTQLWNIVRETTIERFVHARDHFPTIAIETLFSKFKRRVGRIFDNTKGFHE
jgi:nanoRNase/pAp phosphatase (c-di-AMP/oligoRNAs hydrolase)